jgi:hypothetical protein
MYTKVECVALYCDNCKEQFEEFNSGFSIFIDENQAHENADNAGWYLHDGKQYCPDCHWIDDEDNLIIKLIDKK